MISRLLDWLDSQPPPRRRLYTVLIALCLLTVPCYAAGLGLLAFSGGRDAPPPGLPAATSAPASSESPEVPESPAPTRGPAAAPTDPPIATPSPTIVERSEPTPDMAPIILTAPPLEPAEPSPTEPGPTEPVVTPTDSVLPSPSPTEDVIWVTVVPPTPSEVAPAEPTAEP